MAVERSRRGRDVGRGGGARAGPAARTRRRAGGRQDAPIARRRRRGKHRRERPSAPCGTRTSHRARVRRVPFVTNQHARFPSATEFCWRAFSRHPPWKHFIGWAPFRIRHSRSSPTSRSDLLPIGEPPSIRTCMLRFFEPFNRETQRLRRHCSRSAVRRNAHRRPHPPRAHAPCVRRELRRRLFSVPRQVPSLRRRQTRAASRSVKITRV